MRSLLIKVYDAKDETGAIAIIVGALLFSLVGFSALAIDLGHQFVVRNELQNAADAGALGGALVLYTHDGKVNSAANIEARDVAISNLSDRTAVEVDLGGGNDTDVQRGWWDFSTKSFTVSNSEDPADVNAVQVITHRSTSPSILAGIFGYASFSRSAEAVAYLGYAGSSVDFDAPIALCQEKITDPVTGDYDCTLGRMIHSGNSDSNQASAETGRWTNFSLECADPANTPSIKSIVCTGGTSGTGTVSTNNGEVQPVMDKFHDCWVDETGKVEPMHLIVPVIACPPTEPPNCSEIVGAAAIEVVWVTENGADPHFDDIPQEMSWPTGPDAPGVREGWPGDWTVELCAADYASDPGGTLDLGIQEHREFCWDHFMRHFQIFDDDDTPYEKIPVSLYFTPDCDVEIEGGPGGGPFGVVSERPKLVK